MSAIFSYRASDGVIILTDGAAYDEEGILRIIERKVDVSDKAPVAVATRGDRNIGDLLAGKILAAIESKGFDEGLRSIASVMPQWREELERLDDRYTEILVAGISERDGPQHFVCTTSANPDFPIYEWTDPGRQFCGFNGGNGQPMTFTMEGIGLRMPLPGETIIEFFSTIGVGMFEHFRRTRLQSNGCFCVGGHVDMTVVTSAGVEVTRVHRWPDKIGEKINPFAGQNVTPIGNRQQRRAAERAARKAVA